MTRPRNSLIVLLMLSIGLLLFYRFGEQVWRPVKDRLQGKRTTAEVLDKLRPRMMATFADLDEITNGKRIYLLAFKQERLLEVWKQQNGGVVKVCEYPFTAYSGKTGPKLARGDRQIPEGIYHIEYLNPNSSYHLSMKLNYPNDYDRRMAKADGRTDLGDDIFIHGNWVTIGCIPIGDEAIEELFYLVAANGYKNCEAAIAPLDFRQREEIPKIEGLSWTRELYDNLSRYLDRFPLNSG